MTDVTGTERGIQEAFRIDEAKIRGHVDQVVRQSVEQTLNQLLDAEADALCGAKRYREVLGVCEGLKEDKASWLSFLRHLKSRGLRGVKLAISDACVGLVEALGEVLPGALWQRCVVHWYRNVLSIVPKGKAKEVAAMLKAIHAQEDREAALKKAEDVAAKLEMMKLPKAATLVRESVTETLSYMSFPREHWLRIRTNNPLERIMKEIRRRTRVVGAFPDGRSALMLCAARLRHVAGTRWGTRMYLDMNRLAEQEQEREREKEACVEAAA